LKWIKLWTKIIWNADMRELTATQRWIFITLLCLAAENDGIISGNPVVPQVAEWIGQRIMEFDR
jgi:hypothetical protein